MGGAEYVSPHGTPIYMLRKRSLIPIGIFLESFAQNIRNPLYGRRKREASAQQGWTILDPNTGRPVRLVEGSQKKITNI